MKTVLFVILILPVLTAAVYATPGDTNHGNTKGKGREGHQGLGKGNHKTPDPTPGNTVNRNRASARATARAAANAAAIASGGSATATGGNATALGGLGKSAVSNFQGGQGGAGGQGGQSSATSTAAGGIGGQGGNAAGGTASVAVNAGGGWGWGQVYRDNMVGTPWCPIVIPPESVDSIPSRSPEFGDEQTLSFWHFGIRYVLED